MASRSVSDKDGNARFAPPKIGLVIKSRRSENPAIRLPHPVGTKSVSGANSSLILADSRRLHRYN
jgi:hypothetical protein